MNGKHGGTCSKTLWTGTPGIIRQSRYISVLWNFIVDISQLRQSQYLHQSIGRCNVETEKLFWVESGNKIATVDVLYRYTNAVAINVWTGPSLSFPFLGSFSKLTNIYLYKNIFKFSLEAMKQLFFFAFLFRLFPLRDQYFRFVVVFFFFVCVAAPVKKTTKQDEGENIK